ncbi:helix-turn-helix transcriptional regulator [bacterium]|nr:helix-turn-helix transcriptional regulator [bacterium]MBU1599022.1 helix-turn-helix transcriptional regulator [bacterium]
MEELLKRLGNGIRQKRKAEGLSQEDLAKRVSVHPTHLSRIERGKTNPTIVILARISEELGLEIDQWLKVEKKEGIVLDEAIALIKRLEPQSLRLSVSILKGILEWQKDL